MGFTLVEMMLVVAIITVLAVIVYPYFFRAREETKARTCIANLKEIEGATTRWILSMGVGPLVSPGWTDLIPGFLKTRPHCPSKGSYTAGNSNTLPTCNIGTNETLEKYDDHIL